MTGNQEDSFPPNPPFVDLGRYDLDIEELLEQTTAQESNRIEAELQRIDDQLEARDQLHTEIIDELESKLHQYLQRLEQDRKLPGRTESDKLKSDIKQFYRELRNEKREHWKHKQTLERERRELLRELTELEQTFSID